MVVMGLKYVSVFKDVCPFVLSQLFCGCDKITEKSNLEGLFWFTTSEASVHCYLASSLWPVLRESIVVERI
jgi:hypothetical protein